MPLKKKVTTKEIKETNSRLSQASTKEVWIPVLVGAIIVAAFMVGFLYGKVSVYDKLNLKGEEAAVVAKEEKKGPVVTIDQIKAVFNDDSNIVFGDAKSKVLFVEFSDPSCPYCHVAGGMNSELNKQVGERFILTQDGGSYQAPVLEMKKLVDEGKAAFAWFYSPGHGAGELATQAFYCAKDQNKFWEVHDLLMSNEGYDLLNEMVKNDVSKAAELAAFVKDVVNAADLQKCLESGTYAGRIQSDTALSRKLGVQGTPSFFINETNYPGAYNYTEMELKVKTLLK